LFVADNDFDSSSQRNAKKSIFLKTDT